MAIFKTLYVSLFSRPGFHVPADLRLAFERFRHDRLDRTTIPVLKIGTAVLVGLLAIDAFVIPDALAIGFIVRCLIGPIVMALAFRRLMSPRHTIVDHDAVSCVIPILIGFGASLIVASSADPLAPMYITANNITIMFAMLMLGLPPVAAGLVAGIVVLTQIVVVLTVSTFAFSAIALMTAISIAVALPCLSVNVRLWHDLQRQFLAKHRDQLALERDAEQLRRLEAQNVLLARLSALDPLTGLSNRRGFDEMLLRSLEDAKSDPSIPAVALAMIDIDHFKLFNDTLGHPAGDETIRSVALALSRATGREEPVARYGGEEFAVVMPEVSPLALEIIGARLRASIEKLQMPHPASPTNTVVTVSVGIAYADRAAIAKLTPADLLSAADRALYDAKDDGRNKAVIVPWRHQGDAPQHPSDLRRLAHG